MADIVNSNTYWKTDYLKFLAQLAELLVSAEQHTLCVNQGDTNHNCCTQRLVTLHAQTY